MAKDQGVVPGTKVGAGVNQPGTQEVLMDLQGWEEGEWRVRAARGVRRIVSRYGRAAILVWGCAVDGDSCVVARDAKGCEAHLAVLICTEVDYIGSSGQEQIFLPYSLCRTDRGGMPHERI